MASPLDAELDDLDELHALVSAPTAADVHARILRYEAEVTALRLRIRQDRALLASLVDAPAAGSATAAKKPRTTHAQAQQEHAARLKASREDLERQVEALRRTLRLSNQGAVAEPLNPLAPPTNRDDKKAWRVERQAYAKLYLGWLVDERARLGRACADLGASTGLV